VIRPAYNLLREEGKRLENDDYSAVRNYDDFNEVRSSAVQEWVGGG
jgi:hypothetical protein